MPARPILTVAETTAADRAAIAAGTPGEVLMERAGQGVADAIAARFEPQLVTVLCGPGNNGGDGYVVARLLKDAGWPVELRALAEPTTADAQAMRAQLGRADQSLEGPGWRGSRRRRPVRGGSRPASRRRRGGRRPGARRAVRSGGRHRHAERFAGRHRLAAGPGGVRRAHGDLPRPRKPGHVLEPGRSLCGEVVVVDIGLGETPPKLTENSPDGWAERFPWPTARSHKHARGRLIVVSGDAWSTGAARPLRGRG